MTDTHQDRAATLLMLHKIDRAAGVVPVRGIETLPEWMALRYGVKYKMTVVGYPDDPRKPKKNKRAKCGGKRLTRKQRKQRSSDD